MPAVINDLDSSIIINLPKRQAPNIYNMREHDSQLHAKRVRLVGGGITIDPGDIEIGAVELKDYGTDTRANVETMNVPAGGQRNALDVNVLGVGPLAYQRNIVNLTQTNMTVAAGSEVTLVSYTVPLHKVFMFRAYTVSGVNGEEATFRLKKNSTEENLVRTSVAMPSLIIGIWDKDGMELPAASGETIIVTIKHDRVRASAYSATILGYLVDV